MYHGREGRGRDLLVAEGEVGSVFRRLVQGLHALLKSQLRDYSKVNSDWGAHTNWQHTLLRTCVNVLE